MHIAAHVGGVAVFVGILLAVADVMVPGIAAGALLHPRRNTELPAAPRGCTEREWSRGGQLSRGWACEAQGRHRATVVYLHGIADNRGSGVGLITRFTLQGLDVVAFDSRAHGTSSGEICTYGYYEKEDLRRVIAELPQGPVILVGTSLGAAVAIQAAAIEPRVSAVIAAEVFSDLDTVARERAPFFLTQRTIRKALAIVEAQGSFRMADVSPRAAATGVRVPVLLIHGAADSDTPPSHSIRVYDALAGQKRLILVKGAGHNRSLSDATVWESIEGWLSETLAGR